MLSFECLTTTQQQTFFEYEQGMKQTSDREQRWLCVLRGLDVF